MGIDTPQTCNIRDVSWTVEPVALPVSEYVKALIITEIKMDSTTLFDDNVRITRKLAWLHRHQSGIKIDLGCLAINNIHVLHMPNELCVEYQLAAKTYRPDLFVTMAAYADNGPGYICTAKAHDQGGYEAGRVSNVSPDAEGILMLAIRKLFAE